MKRSISVGALVLVCACGGDDDGGGGRIDGGGGGGIDGGGGGGTATVNLALYNGATPAGMAFAAPVLPGGVGPADGKWLVSPNRLTVTVGQVSLGGEQPTPITDVDCEVTFDIAEPGLASLGDCALEIPAGTYDTLNLSLKTDVTAHVDDVVNSLYSTADGLVTVLPEAGTEDYTYEIEGTDGLSGLSPFTLPEELVVEDGDDVELSAVINGLQSLRFTVAGGTVTDGWAGTSYADPGRPDIVATAGGLAKVKVYASPDLATAGSYCAGGCADPPPTGVTSVSVYYVAETAVTMVGLQLNDTPDSCAQTIGASFVNDPRGYAGRDAEGVVAWAVPTTSSWATYSAVFAMAEAAEIAEVTPLYCLNLDGTDPAPVGGSFASGAPDLASDGVNLGDYTLVAQ